MILDNVNKSVEVLLGEAAGTELDINAYWVDIDATRGTFTPAHSDLVTTGVTAVLVVPVPTIGVKRWVKKVVVVNTDTIKHLVTIRLHNALTGFYRVFERETVLLPGKKLVYIG